MCAAHGKRVRRGGSPSPKRAFACRRVSVTSSVVISGFSKERIREYMEGDVSREWKLTLQLLKVFTLFPPDAARLLRILVWIIHGCPISVVGRHIVFFKNEEDWQVRDRIGR